MLGAKATEGAVGGPHKLVQLRELPTAFGSSWSPSFQLERISLGGGKPDGAGLSDPGRAEMYASRMRRRLPPNLLEEHGVKIVGPDGSPEPVWQQVLRLNASLWRQEQGLGATTTSNGLLGSCLANSCAQKGKNLMSDAARLAAERELKQPGKLIERDRLYKNLLTSQALCFSIFGDLQNDLSVASKVIGALLGVQIEVTRIELEHSPGRGDRSYTGDFSAADAYIEYTAGNRRGFLCVETKYFENLALQPNWKDTYRPRYSEVAAGMGCFRAGCEAILKKPPLEQLWRDHLLAGSILHHPREQFDEGHFVLLYPTWNESCTYVVEAYRDCLSDSDTFRVWSLEEVANALLDHARYDWASSLRDRYLNHGRVDRAYQDHYLKNTTCWAKAVREDLGALQTREGHRVWFRPSSSGFAMVGLQPEKPQLGNAYNNTTHLIENFESEFTRHCDGPVPKRPTPEKKLQSFLVSDALTHERRLQKIDDALVFLTDELVIPSFEGDQRLDILALRRVSQGARLALIELKSERAMTELLQQTQAYADFLNNHRERLAGLATAILGEPVVLTEPAEKWIVWRKSVRPGPDPKITEFSKVGVRLVGYEEVSNGFDFECSSA